MNGPMLVAAAERHDDDYRRRRRELIRALHPDRGGDPTVFIAVLQSLAEESVRRRPTEVRFAVRRRRLRFRQRRRSVRVRRLKRFT